VLKLNLLKQAPLSILLTRVVHRLRKDKSHCMHCFMIVMLTIIS